MKPMSPAREAFNAAVVVMLIGVFVDRMVKGSSWAALPLLIAIALAAMMAYEVAHRLSEMDRRSRDE